MIKVVIEKSDIFRFTLHLFNHPVGTFSNVEIKSSMTTDAFYKICLKLGTEDLSMNKEMCNFVKTNYGKLVELNYFGIKIFKNYDSIMYIYVYEI
jgi:hypothetical protein